MDDQETLHRRARLRELIAIAFEGRLKELLTHIEQRTKKRANQGELSALQKDNGPKSFGDKKAKTLTEQIGLHRQWFSMPIGTNLHRHEWLDGFDATNPDVAELAEVVSRLTSSGKMQATEVQAMIAMLKAREGQQ